ncbi:MAG: hypothetical protein O7D95_01540 [Betaproteobacteria bacterium]|nr:hypothetical protein [Betaproteobacteria bacterium]
MGVSIVMEEMSVAMVEEKHHYSLVSNKIVGIGKYHYCESKSQYGGVCTYMSLLNTTMARHKYNYGDANTTLVGKILREAP